MQARRLFSLAGCGLLLTTALHAQEAEKVPAPGETKPIVAQTLLRQLDDAFVQVFEKVAPAVVVIEAKKENENGTDLSGLDMFFKNPRGRQFRMPDDQRSEGSGFIIRADGYILTNNHVIADADGLEVRMRDGRRFPAKVVGIDDKTDVAVLKIEAKDLPVAELGDSAKVRVGQLVCAIGIPYSLDYSFTCGWVSAKGRSNLTNTAYEDYIQTDAFINPGNSGGPLFDVDGKVIGMNTLINGIGRGLAFAIPSNMLREVGDQLIESGKVLRPWLGIRIETLGDNPQLAAQFPGIDKGVIVETIEMNAPANKSDLRPADIITQVDGAPVTTARELQREILKKKIGDTVQLSIWRNGRTMKIPVPTGELPSEVTRAVNPAPTPEPDAPEADDILGMQVQAVDAALAENLKLGSTGGLVVTDVRDDTPAADAGIQREDVITEIDQKAVGDLESFKKQVAEAKGERGVLLFIERKGRKTYGVLKPRE